MLAGEQYFYVRRYLSEGELKIDGRGRGLLHGTGTNDGIPGAEPGVDHTLRARKKRHAGHYTLYRKEITEAVYSTNSAHVKLSYHCGLGQHSCLWTANVIANRVCP